MAKKITELVAEVAAPVAQEQGCTLWDVEYVREAGQWTLIYDVSCKVSLTSLP